MAENLTNTNELADGMIQVLVNTTYANYLINEALNTKACLELQNESFASDLNKTAEDLKMAIMNLFKFLCGIQYDDNNVGWGLFCFHEAYDRSAEIIQKLSKEKFESGF